MPYFCSRLQELLQRRGHEIATSAVDEEASRQSHRLATNRPCRLAPVSEFWRTIKPIANVFRAGALPAVYLSKVADGDERYFVPFSETVSSKPLWISPQRNVWADVLTATTAGLVNRHYHPHQVLAYMISGKLVLGTRVECDG